MTSVEEEEEEVSIYLLTIQRLTCVQNIFKNLSYSITPDKNNFRDEIDRYLGAKREAPDNVLQWWIDRRQEYPRLSRMAIDYLTIPGK